MRKSATVPPAERGIADLTLAAFLSSQKHQLIRIEARSGRSFFVFHCTPELQHDEMAFLNRAAAVEPLSFAETLRYFKGALR